MNAPLSPARLAAAAGAAVLGAGLFALPASAQAPVPVDVVHPSDHRITADDSEHAGSLTIVFGEDFAEGEHDVTAVFDLAPDTGVYYWADNDPSYGGCGPDATTALLHCEAEDAGRTVDFSYLYAAETGAEPGEHPYTVTIAVDGETALVVDETMEVVAPESGSPYLHGDQAFEDVEPGTSADVRPEFLQAEALPDDTVAVVVTLRGSEYVSYGLAWPRAEYDNCIANDYAPEVVCVVTEYEDLPGTAFTFRDSTWLDVDASAPGPMDLCGCSYSVEPIGETTLEDQYGGVFWDEDSDDLFGLMVAGDPESPFEDPYNGYLDIRTAEHPYDLALTDRTVKGAKGDEATVTIPVQNLGTAAAPTVFDGPGSYALVGELPAGTRLVSVEGPDDGWYCEGDASQYLDTAMPDVDADDADFICLFQRIDAGATLDVELTVEVTDASARGAGSLTIAALGSADYPGELDANWGNNTADLTLNGAGSGQLPKTGSSLTWILAGAAAALALGIVLFVATRRRKGGDVAQEAAGDQAE
ncbi:LPXTG cell wall anchor domain-containing protein [Glycomyces sp. NPDC047369]